MEIVWCSTINLKIIAKILIPSFNLLNWLYRLGLSGSRLPDFKLSSNLRICNGALNLGLCYHSQNFSGNRVGYQTLLLLSIGLIRFSVCKIVMKLAFIVIYSSLLVIAWCCASWLVSVF